MFTKIKNIKISIILLLLFSCSNEKQNVEKVSFIDFLYNYGNIKLREFKLLKGNVLVEIKKKSDDSLIIHYSLVTKVNERWTKIIDSCQNKGKITLFFISGNNETKIKHNNCIANFNQEEITSILEYHPFKIVVVNGKIISNEVISLETFPWDTPLPPMR